MFSLFKRNPKTTSGIAAVALAIGSMILPWEGYKDLPYKDIVGVWTDCHGETTGVVPGVARGRAKCDALLLTRVENDYYLPLTRCVSGFKVLPVQVQAAGISLAYNVGVGATCKSSYARLAERGHIKEACDALLKFNRAGGKVVKGLQNRREAERKVCLQGA